jgi:HK97 family phage portal protein
MWPFKKSVPETRHAETKSAILGTTPELGSFLMLGYNEAATPSSAIALYEESSAASIPINKIVDAFVSIEPVLQNIDDKQLTYNHEIIELLNQPSPYFDGALFMQTIATDYLVTDECHIVALGNKGRAPLELQPLSPKNVSPVEGNGGVPSSFIVSGNTLAGDYKPERDGKTIHYLDGPLRELRQIRGFSTKNNSLLRGQSRLVNAAREVRQNILGGKHNVSLLEKGGRVSLVFHYGEDSEIQDFDELKDRVRSQSGGADKAGQIGVSTGGKLQIEELGKTNKDMDFALLQRMAADTVALQYNVPLPLVSNDSSTFNNFRDANLALYDWAVLPLFDKIFTAIGSWLLPRYGMDPRKYRLTYDPLSIPALRTRILDELEKRSKIGIETDNELRATIARDPYPEGDTHYKAANLLPVGADIAPSEPQVIRDQNTDTNQ